MATSKGEGKRGLSSYKNIEDEDDEEDEEDEDGSELGYGDNYDERKKRTTINNSSSSKKGSFGSSVGGSTTRPHCQANDCNVDLTYAKQYHRRHKVCEFHAKATMVVVAGLPQRFCQQCSRFHVLSEFDETKRSCRRRLTGHNERRRKSLSDFQAGYSST